MAVQELVYESLARMKQKCPNGSAMGGRTELSPSQLQWLFVRETQEHNSQRNVEAVLHHHHLTTTLTTTSPPRRRRLVHRRLHRAAAQKLAPVRKPHARVLIKRQKRIQMVDVVVVLV